mmetsp:Transcript_29696/g.34962  ORF Transcript_29696/g.34962 Transcript_29696/m.34962 type:complete len:240 (-) Transcript_29696:198-917(-)|eukprot:CAMPEP_0114340482 /NCGR_PEP_ID=MMETSP0101-20121206/8402_1 /TAXON_ID=38822 ORGANISM="Pteridomonas danica, Strain PT" /NCGR_SAMPLE_ID=MMETSP0101 /ASSEMBLY_ACC=CAM_ASM_000211 /LENGTH=239 /DNA_ID=CAMNT_0001473751 /DNA_START=244 /DNA_END=963 /DNA_ORIENTATION=+
MSHDDYVILGTDSQSENNYIQPPLMKRSPPQQKRRFCWPFWCCCPLSRRTQESDSVDSLLQETECPPKYPSSEVGTYLNSNHPQIPSSSTTTSSSSHDNDTDYEDDSPGSDLQNAIALSLQVQGLGGEPLEPECVICLDGFDPTNPRLPTLCECGIGKVNFHHNCLKKWISQNGACTCPSCYTTLYYEELDPVIASPSPSTTLLPSSFQQVEVDDDVEVDNESLGLESLGSDSDYESDS